MNTNYFIDLIAGNLFGSKKSPGIPTSLYLGLSKTAPNNYGGNVSEPSGAGYARVKITNLSAPVGGVVSNNAPINFPESSGSWGKVTHFLIYDAPTNGNLLIYDSLTTPRTVEPGTTLTLRTKSLQLAAQSPA